MRSAAAGLRRATGDTAGSAAGRPAAMASDSCGLTDLAEMCAVTDDDRRALALTGGWSDRWMTTWKVAGGKVTCPVADMGAFPVPGCEPVRHFTWSTRQAHRPGLQSLAGTGRLHGFESHAEQRLLLALDFLGVREVVSQPHRMRFESASGPREHTPDFLAVTGEGTWLLMCGPRTGSGQLTGSSSPRRLRQRWPAGWRYGVVGGWRPQVMTTLDTLSAQRRPLSDPLGLTGALLAAVAGGPVRFADLVAATCYPVGLEYTTVAVTCLFWWQPAAVRRRPGTHA